jgi:hypothetical protein
MPLASNVRKSAMAGPLYVDGGGAVLNCIEGVENDASANGGVPRVVDGVALTNVSVLFGMR